MCKSIRHVNTENHCVPFIQGNFHQANARFGSNAGLQCLPNCLSALTYNKLLSATEWTAFDMDKILITGNELYDTLQRYTSIPHQYLLISDLPRNLDIHAELFSISLSDSIGSLIPLPLDEQIPDLRPFNAKPLKEALCCSLSNTDGCFICFNGNTMLVGKVNQEYFIFDSHSRSPCGKLSENGKSLCRIVQSIQDIYMHVNELAQSMGFTTTVECEVTGVSSNFGCISQNDPSQGNNIKGVSEDVECEITGVSSNISCISQNAASPENNIKRFSEDVVYLGQEQNIATDFRMISANTKKRFCNTYQIPLYDDRNFVAIDKSLVPSPFRYQRVLGDGNCFFRAISCCMSGSEDAHDIMRTKMCEHVRENHLIFGNLLRSNIESLQGYINRMCIPGTWATEFEIIAMSHMLHVEIFTFSDGIWKKFSGRLVDKYWVPIEEAIYLDNENENHYNVVVSMTSFNTEREPIYQIQDNIQSKVEQNRKRKRQWSQKQYHKNKQFRAKLLQQRKSAYTKSRSTKLQQLKVKYSKNKQFRQKLQNEMRNKYRQNEKIKAHIKASCKYRYQTNTKYKGMVQKRSQAKYHNDDLFKMKVKEYSKTKYNRNMLFREKIKVQNRLKYKSDKQLKVKKINDSKQNHTKTNHRGRTKEHLQNMCKDNTQFQGKREISREKSKLNNHEEAVKVKQTKKMNAHERDLMERDTKEKKGTIGGISQNQLRKSTIETSLENPKTQKERKENKEKANLKHEKQDKHNFVMENFKKKTKEQPCYPCSCCHRILFKNQVLEYHFENFKKKSESICQIAKVCVTNKYSHQCSETCPKGCLYSSQWLCKTCYAKLMRGQIPAESAINNMDLKDIPNALKDLNSLEKHLIALHIPFMKVACLPRGGQNAIYGPVICVPTDTHKVMALPRNVDDEMLIRVKLKRKLEFKGHYEYQFVHPSHVQKALDFLKEHNKY